MDGKTDSTGIPRSELGELVADVDFPVGLSNNRESDRERGE